MLSDEKCLSQTNVWFVRSVVSRYYLFNHLSHSIWSWERRNRTLFCSSQLQQQPVKQHFFDHFEKDFGVLKWKNINLFSKNYMILIKSVWTLYSKVWRVCSLQFRIRFENLVCMNVGICHHLEANVDYEMPCKRNLGFRHVF